MIAWAPYSVMIVFQRLVKHHAIGQSGLQFRGGGGGDFGAGDVEHLDGRAITCSDHIAGPLRVRIGMHAGEIVTVAEADRMCGCCGKALKLIGEEITEQRSGAARSRADRADQREQHDKPVVDQEVRNVATAGGEVFARHPLPQRHGPARE